MKKSNFLLCYSNGTYETVSCSRDPFESLVFNRFDQSGTLDCRITHIAAFQYVDGFYHFVFRYYAQGFAL